MRILSNSFWGLSTQAKYRPLTRPKPKTFSYLLLHKGQLLPIIFLHSSMFPTRTIRPPLPSCQGDNSIIIFKQRQKHLLWSITSIRPVLFHRLTKSFLLSPLLMRQDWQLEIPLQYRIKVANSSRSITCQSWRIRAIRAHQALISNPIRSIFSPWTSWLLQSPGMKSLSERKTSSLRTMRLC